MSIVLGGLTGDSFSGDTSWIAPWTSSVLDKVKNGTNPYDVIIPTLEGVFYPHVQSGFRPQLWVLLGLFILSALVVLLGLALRLNSGRLWIFHRIDSTVIIPNISVCYGLCALVYAALGIVSIIDAVRVSRGGDYPSHYIGLQGAWPLILWLGMYAELWATYSAFYIRRFGSFYESSRVKTAVATLVPTLLPVAAIVPPAVLFAFAARHFNNAFTDFASVRTLLAGFQASWKVEDGIDIINLTSIITPVAKLAQSFVDYSFWGRRGFMYEAVVLLVTFFAYTAGACLEIGHLRRQASKLRRQAALSPTMRRPMSPDPVNRKVADQLDEEWFAGVRRQASLLEWAARNRTWTAALIAIMLLESAALALWYGLAPPSITNNATSFQTQILVACYMNGILSTLVSLLILFRSLDGSNPSARALQAALPWLPLPPAVGLRGQETTLAQKTVELCSSAFNGGEKEEEANGGGKGLGLQVPSASTPRWGSPLMVQLEMMEKEVEELSSGSSSSDKQ